MGAAGHSIAAPVTRPAMPSLLYIARITRFSEELAEELRSSGFHVKAFGPGEITADECWLVMTSEAVLASLQPTNSASAAGTEPGAKGMPPLTEMNAQLGSQARIWQIIERAAPPEPATHRAQPSLVAPTSNGEDRGFIPSEHRRRALTTPQHKSVETSPSLPVLEEKSALTTAIPGISPLPLLTRERSQMEPAQTSVISPAQALPGAGKIRSVFGSVTRKRYNLIWRPMAATAALLFFAVVLLTHRASTLPLTRDEMAGDTDQSTPSDADSKDSITPPTPSSTEAPSAGARQHHSDYDFVAEDFTNHFATQAHGKPSVQNPKLQRNAQNSPNQKRVVVN